MSGFVNVSLDTSNDYVAENSSNTSSCPIAEKPVGIREVNIAIHVITLVVALVGNNLLITAFVKMKEPLMLLIANMAASDLLTALFFLPRLITIEVVGSYSFQLQGLVGTIACKMSFFLSDISISVSTQSLVIIAVERLLAVVYPLRARNITAKTRRVLIASTWLVAIAFHSPYLYTFELVKVKNGNIICLNKWALDDEPAFLRYVIFLFVTVLLIPLVVISILYPIIFINLGRDKMAGHRISKRIRRNRERNMKLLKLALATVLSLLICYTSFIVITLFRLLAPDTLPKCSYSFIIIEFISIMVMSSYCAVNPFICFIFLRNFRGELRIMCRGKRQGSKVIDNNISGRTRSSTASTSCRVESHKGKSNSVSSQDTFV